MESEFPARSADVTPVWLENPAAFPFKGVGGAKERESSPGFLHIQAAFLPPGLGLVSREAEQRENATAVNWDELPAKVRRRNSSFQELLGVVATGPDPWPAQLYVDLWPINSCPEFLVPIWEGWWSCCDAPMSSFSWLWNLARMRFVILMLSPGVEVKVPPTGDVWFLPGQTQQFHADTAPNSKTLEETELDLILKSFIKSRHSCSCGEGYSKGISCNLGKEPL